MTGMTEMFVKSCILLHAGILEKLNSTEIITSRQKLTIFGPITAIYVTVINTWPDTLHWEPKKARPRFINKLFG